MLITVQKELSLLFARDFKEKYHDLVMEILSIRQKIAGFYPDPKTGTIKIHPGYSNIFLEIKLGAEDFKMVCKYLEIMGLNPTTSIGYKALVPSMSYRHVPCKKYIHESYNGA
jgi:hypothetical protein